MRRLLLLPALIAGLCALAPARAQAPSNTIDLSGTWKFFKGDNLAWAKPEFDDTLWKEINAPGSWQSQAYPELLGFAWYRKHVNVPAEWGRDNLVKEGKTLWMDLGKIGDSYEVYWNGTVIGKGGKFPPDFQSANGSARVGVPSDRTSFGADNVLAVRVYDKTAPGGIIAGPLSLRQPTFGDFINVNIETKPDEAGRQRTEFKGPEGLPFDVLVENTGPATWEHGTVMLTVLDGGGKPLVQSPIPMTVSAGKANRTTLQLKEEQLNPGIYTVLADVQMNGARLNSAARTFVYNPAGIRTETFRTPEQYKAFAPKMDQFWKTTIAALKNTPIGGTSTLDTAKSTATVKVYKVSFNSLKGQTIYGWFVAPAAATKAPGVVVLPGYGNSSVEPPILLAESGFAALAINVHGSDVNAATYPSETDTYMKGGVADPNTFVYRSMVAAGLRAVDYLSQRPEVDPDHLAVIGASQGGGLAIDVAALDPRLKTVVANSPAADFPRMFATATKNPVSGLVSALSPTDRTELNGTLAYFEPAILAERLRVPVLITIGMHDAVTPPETAYAIKNAVPPGVVVTINADESAGHGATPQQAQFSLNWLKKFLIG